MNTQRNNAANTRDYIVRSLRESIIQGHYKANQPLRQDQIAQDLGVSKIPLREALVQLKAEGLVTFLPKRGAIVSELSRAEVEEIYRCVQTGFVSGVTTNPTLIKKSGRNPEEVYQEILI